MIGAIPMPTTKSIFLWVEITGNNNINNNNKNDYYYYYIVFIIISINTFIFNYFKLSRIDSCEWIEVLNY